MLSKYYSLCSKPSTTFTFRSRTSSCRNMWRSHSHICQVITTSFRRGGTLLPPLFHTPARFFSAPTKDEVRKLMRLVDVEALKRRLGDQGKDVIGYGELLRACESVGVARTQVEAKEFAKVLDDAGVVFLWRDRVYLYPHKVVELVSSSVPLALTPEDDPRREELKILQEKKEWIDAEAHKQVRLMLWGGLSVAIMQVGLFFRLTYWDFSWDVMEPVAFFATASGIVISYGYFMITSKDPTYRDLMKRLFLSRQRKLIKKTNFDIIKYKELLDRCKCPFDKKHYQYWVLEDV